MREQTLDGFRKGRFPVWPWQLCVAFEAMCGLGSYAAWAAICGLRAAML
jgi:hypothetical protein